MDIELIRTWLGLAPGLWPPNHYDLLGLPTEAADQAIIEQHAYERMESVRRYQLLHPESATEALNRLAQAFLCLSDPVAKAGYDAWLSGPAAPAVVDQDVKVSPERMAEHPLAWLIPELPPSGQSVMTAAETGPVINAGGVSNQESTAAAIELPPAAGASQPAEGAAAPLPSGQESVVPTVGRQSLSSKRGLYFHIARTRQLRFAWQRAGKYLGDSKKIIRRPGEATELIRAMEEIRHVLQTVPLLLAEAGQPGYMILALARQTMIVPMFQTLLPSQREALARDWQAGHDQLCFQHTYFRSELRKHRHRNTIRRSVRAAWSFIVDHPGLVLLLMALAALNIAFVEDARILLMQLGACGVIVGLRLALWWRSMNPARLATPTLSGNLAALPAAQNSARNGTFRANS